MIFSRFFIISWVIKLNISTLKPKTIIYIFILSLRSFIKRLKSILITYKFFAFYFILIYNIIIILKITIKLSK